MKSLLYARFTLMQLCKMRFAQAPSTTYSFEWASVPPENAGKMSVHNFLQSHSARELQVQFPQQVRFPVRAVRINSTHTHPECFSMGCRFRPVAGTTRTDMNFDKQHLYGYCRSSMSAEKKKKWCITGHLCIIK